MPYTKEELESVQKQLQEIADMKAEMEEKLNSFRELSEKLIEPINKSVAEAREKLKEMDEKCLKENGVTQAEYNRIHKDEINEYILSHPEEFGEDPILIHD